MIHSVPYSKPTFAGLYEIIPPQGSNNSEFVKKYTGNNPYTDYINYFMLIEDEIAGDINFSNTQTSHNYEDYAAIFFHTGINKIIGLSSQTWDKFKELKNRMNAREALDKLLETEKLRTIQTMDYSTTISTAFSSK